MTQQTKELKLRLENLQTLIEQARRVSRIVLILLLGSPYQTALRYIHLRILQLRLRTMVSRAIHSCAAESRSGGVPASGRHGKRGYREARRRDQEARDRALLSQAEQGGDRELGTDAQTRVPLLSSLSLAPDHQHQRATCGHGAAHSRQRGALPAARGRVHW